jgi:AcrR family transcriptional regulator
VSFPLIVDAAADAELRQPAPDGAIRLLRFLRHRPIFAKHFVSVNTKRIYGVVPYTTQVPKLWNDTIEAHRREVRQAILDTTWKLATERGPASVKMSEVAEQTGIGRTTLYKYFSDVDAILAAWTQRQVLRHVALLRAARDDTKDPGKRLRVTLETYAHIQQQRARHLKREPHGSQLATLLHQNDDGVADAQRQLHNLVRDVLADAAQAGDIRGDIAADELAGYCLHALAAAATLGSEAAVRRLVAVTLAGLQPR